MKKSWVPTVCPVLLAILGVVLLALWVGAATVRFEMRVPGMDGTPAPTERTDEPLAVAGEPIRGGGVPADIPGAWPAFRGANRDAICDDGTTLARTWPAEGPPVLWRRALGEGYAGAVIRDGRVYLLDYVVDETVETLRGLKKA
nr:polyvinylalcohol dehydrogenase [Planctomycetota bacterium]